MQKQGIVANQDGISFIVTVNFNRERDLDNYGDQWFYSDTHASKEAGLSLASANFQSYKLNRVKT